MKKVKINKDYISNNGNSLERKKYYCYTKITNTSNNMPQQCLG